MHIYFARDMVLLRGTCWSPQLRTPSIDESRKQSWSRVKSRSEFLLFGTYVPSKEARLDMLVLVGSVAEWCGRCDSSRLCNDSRLLSILR
jgi:thiol-disulfide isomerase/thioredoxin